MREFVGALRLVVRPLPPKQRSGAPATLPEGFIQGGKNAVITDDDLFDTMAAELRAREAPLTIVLTPLTALDLAGILQLAMRHPGIRDSNTHGGTATMVIEHVRRFFHDAPAILEVLERGDDPAHDYPPSARPQ